VAQTPVAPSSRTSASQARRLVTPQGSPPHADVSFESSVLTISVLGAPTSVAPRFPITPVVVDTFGTPPWRPSARPGAPGAAARRLQAATAPPHLAAKQQTRPAPSRGTHLRSSLYQGGQGPWTPARGSAPAAVRMHPARGSVPAAVPQTSRFQRKPPSPLRVQTPPPAGRTRRPGYLTRVADDRVASEARRRRRDLLTKCARRDHVPADG